jgi:CHAD domain-containing protein
VAYHFDADESVRAAVVRCAREQLDDAVSQLNTGVDTDPAKAVHEARKSVKKSRALLRFLRGSMPPQQRRRENAVLRDAARGLSGVRDADVMVGTVDRLSDAFAGQVPERTFLAVREKLDEARRGHSGFAVDAALRSDAVQDLGSALLRAEGWQLKQGGWRALKPGLRETYRRGRKAFRQAHAEPTLENLHEWRKRVKDLWYELRLLQPVCGPAVKGQAKEAGQLSDLLGDDHDLGVLSQTVTEMSGNLAVDVEALQALIEHRRVELQLQAFFAGERLYAERPKAFVRRIHSYWRAGRGRFRAESAGRPAELATATRKAHAIA